MVWIDLEKILYDADLILIPEGKNNPQFRRQLLDAKPYLEAFCAGYGKKLQKIGVTFEKSNGTELMMEPMYFFDDGLGGYTLEAFKDEYKVMN